jgi:branched-subunit amino acid ABC-type transport system permease component
VVVFGITLLINRINALLALTLFFAYAALNGLTIGAIYILLASGLTIVFGLQGIVNVAHGVFYMLGAYLALSLYPRVGFALTLVIAFLATALLGLVLELAGVRPLVRWKREGSQVLVLTLGVAIIASEVTKLIWGAVPQQSEVPPALAGVVTVGPLSYPIYWLFVIAFTAAFMALLALAFYKTTLGILVQAIALNRDIAEAMGTNAPRIVAIAGSSTADPIPTGTVMPFYQNAAPAGWTIALFERLIEKEVLSAPDTAPR